MILYRLQGYPETEDWWNQYEPTQEKGLEELRKATVAEIPARLDRLEIEGVTGNREGMCDFLNQLHGNHMVQEPSEFIERNF